MSKSSQPVPKLPTKWAVVGLVVVICYFLLKPWLEERFQITLPGGADTSVAVQEEDPSTSSGDGAVSVASSDAGLVDLVAELGSEDVDPFANTTLTSIDETDPAVPAPGTPPAQPVKKPKLLPKIAEPQKPVIPTTPIPAGTAPGTSNVQPQEPQLGQTDPAKSEPEKSEPEKPKLGQLKPGANKVYTSTAGLKYGPGSADGHRLLHVMKHAVDAPDKPIHGVYSGTKEEILALIDEAWLLVKAKSPQVKSEEEGDRMVYTIEMKRKIGFTGGSIGKRKNHPVCTKLRIVVEDDNEVVTAFPTDR